tara:strand:- start:115 stop:456 length:342 start_codon:yes stop_codon:yes gene_type:complete
LIKNILKKKSLSYFSYFSNKSIQDLDNMFSKNISLKDWSNKISGKKKVIKFNLSIFKRFKKINVKVKSIAVNKEKKIVFCEITIKLDKITLDVIDVLMFDRYNKISQIKAYKL